MYAIDMTKIGEAPIPEPLKAMLINEFQAKQSAAHHTLSWCCRRYRQGKGHGTLHPDDTHVPLWLMGWGIHHGSSNATVNITDIAPTISMLLHIQMPNGNIGHVIEGVIK